MGTKSYVVRGLGNARSWTSCSHGAGRKMSRSEAERTHTAADLREQMGNRVWQAGLADKLIDEIPSAYKDIDEVMAAQSDLVEIVHTLRQVLNYKGPDAGRSGPVTPPPSRWHLHRPNGEAAMAQCDLCLLEMTDDDVTCVATAILTNTGVFQPVPFGREQVRGWRATRCGDCGVRRDGFHHRGCDMEECPRCAGQLISCGCDESELTADDMADDDFDPFDVRDSAEELHTDVFLRAADAAPVLAHLRELSPVSAQGLLDLMANHVGTGRVVRFCVIQAEAATFDANRAGATSTRSDQNWWETAQRSSLRVHERAVGGDNELVSLDVTNRLVEVPFDWTNVAPQNRVAVEAALAHLDRVLAAERVPVELVSACRHFLAFCARSPLRRLGADASGARVAAGVVWAVFVGNDFFDRRRGWPIGSVWGLFGVTPSARGTGVALRRAALLASTGETLGYRETSLGRPEFYTLARRQQIAAEAARIRAWPRDRAS